MTEKTIRAAEKTTRPFGWAQRRIVKMEETLWVFYRNYAAVGYLQKEAV